MKNTLALVLMVFGLVGCTPEYKENGFSNQQTYEAAMQGGFLSEKDYRKAKKYNYTSKKEWDEVIALSKDKGYHSLDEYFLMSKTNSSTTILECKATALSYPPNILHINQDNFEYDGSRVMGKIKIEYFGQYGDAVAMPSENGYSPIVKDTIRNTPTATKTSKMYRFYTRYKDIYEYSKYELDRDSLTMINESRLSKYWSKKYDEYSCKLLSLEDYLEKRTEYANSTIEYLDSIQASKEQFKNSPKEF
ncbi:hypothetical protein N8365_01415 [Gammaproteobacteria bacterium]|nr:hypothetical protein [Gammaproteobacteria bacterium]